MSIIDGKWKVLRTLGSGFSATTKLCEHIDNGEQAALKVFDLTQGDINQNMLNLINTEFSNCKDFNHNNIVKYYDCNMETTEVKENGNEKKVAYIAMEPIRGGELFDYVANSGAFNERFSRYYFKQMLTGLHYLHKNGMAHRDLKPENVMLSEKYEVKVIDFGFTCNIAGRNGSGSNSSGVGTPGYMAPEILQKRPYQSNNVDLFALGVVLFIMYAGHPPFSSAKEDDTHYRCIAQQRIDLFWKAHCRNKPEGFFTEEFKDLITSMFQLQPHMRLCMSDILGHPFMMGDYPSEEEVVQEFSRRDQVNKDRAAADEERKQEVANAANDRRARRGAETRNIYMDASAVPEDLQDKPNVLTRSLKTFTEDYNKHINFYSKADATEVMAQLTNYLDTQDKEFTVSDKTFKVTYKDKRQINSLPIVDDEDMEEVKQEDPIYEICTVAIKLLKVDDSKICVDFQRKDGSSLHFYEAIGKLKVDLSLFNNTTLAE